MLQNRYTKYSTKGSEEFNTASRSVKSGLIAAGIVSAWTWAATLLQSCTVAYEYGISGPFWVRCQNLPYENTSLRLNSVGLIPFSLGRFELITTIRCRRGNGADFHVCNSGLQSEAECSSMPYLSRDHPSKIWLRNTHGIYLLCTAYEHSGCQSASARWKCSCHCSNWHECLCCNIPDPSRSLRLCGTRWLESYVPLFVHLP